MTSLLCSSVRPAWKEIANNAKIAKQFKIEKPRLGAPQFLNLDFLAIFGDCGNFR